MSEIEYTYFIGIGQDWLHFIFASGVSSLLVSNWSWFCQSSGFPFSLNHTWSRVQLILVAAHSHRFSLVYNRLLLSFHLHQFSLDLQPEFEVMPCSEKYFISYSYSIPPRVADFNISFIFWHSINCCSCRNWCKRTSF